MKNLLLPIVCAAIAFALPAQAQIASDNASNYVTWGNGSNAGTGFLAWNLYTTAGNGTAGFFLGNSTAQGFGNINTADKAFGMYGNPAGTNYANAERLFSNSLNNGEAFLIDLAIAFRNGNKGISLFINNGFNFGDQVWNFNVTGDQYRVQNADLGWSYNQQSIFAVQATQVSPTQLMVSLTRGVDNFTANYTVTSALTGFRLYVGDTEAGDDLNNLFANNMSVIPEPTAFALLSAGLGAWILRRKTNRLS